MWYTTAAQKTTFTIPDTKFCAPVVTHQHKVM